MTETADERRIDATHLNYLFAGARMRCDMLKLEDITAGHRHAMNKMGMAAIHRKRNTSISIGRSM